MRVREHVNARSLSLLSRAPLVLFVSMPPKTVEIHERSFWFRFFFSSMAN